MYCIVIAMANNIINYLLDIITDKRVIITIEISILEDYNLICG